MASVAVGQRYRVKEPFSALCVWWYDTVAIQADYSDSAETELPAGSGFRVAELETAEIPFIRCELDAPEPVRTRVLPKDLLGWRGWFNRIGTRVVGFAVLLSQEQIEARCELSDEAEGQGCKQ